MMRPVVMKFGGTSVEDSAAISRLTGIVRERGGEYPVVVVSALRGVTDSLLGATHLAADGDLDAAADRFVPQVERHLTIAADLLDGDDRATVERAVSDAIDEIRNLLAVVRGHPGTRLPLQDEIVSFGERLSSLLVAAALRATGTAAEMVDARKCIRTTEEHTSAAPLPDLTRAATRGTLVPLLEASVVPVLGGFIGSAENGATTTLGRGGSDFSGAIVGAALGAAEIQIWTDVTGFLTADPRIVPDARPLSRLSYAEAAELAFFGARVLHPKTIHPAVETHIPVRVCNSRLPHLAGTLINGESETSAGGVKAIAHRAGVSLVQVTSTRMLGAYGFLRALFEVFDRHRTGVDIVSTSEVSVSLSVESTRRLPAIVAELEELGSVRVSHGNAIVCVVGEGIGEMPGIAAKVFGTISDVNVVVISQGASSINLTFVVAEKDVEDTVRRLHAEFFPDG